MAGTWRWSFVLVGLLVVGRVVRAQPGPVGQGANSIWIEAENMGPLNGSNFSFQPVAVTTKGSWSLSGPGVAAEWTQGGESEWSSIAARADEPGEVVVGRDVEVPAAGMYTLWVRYADYRGKKEAFGIRIKQGSGVSKSLFGDKPVVDEQDPMKVLWDWAFGWGSVQVELQKGPARVELYTTGPAEARRQVDCICLTTDASYRPAGRNKPDHPAWAVLRSMQKAGMPEVEALVPAKPVGQTPAAWKIATAPPTFLWNTSTQWQDELKKPIGQRVEAPFAIDPPILAPFLEMFKGKQDVPLYGNALAGPCWHIPMYTAVFGKGTPENDWVNRHPERKFAVLLNYADPKFEPNTNRQEIYGRLKQMGDRFLGYVAGESISYAYPDPATLAPKVKAARSRGEVLAALKQGYSEVTAKKFSDYAGRQLSAAEVWGPIISCLSASNEAFCHAIGEWGAKRIGHESSGNGPTLARRLAFLRGASRQMGMKLVDYQSCNFGDASTIYSRESYFYPASSRYILDNQYDAWAGAGMNFTLKDYTLFHLAGADVFYHEEGVDLYWKPGGGSAGDEFPLQYSPRGRITEYMMKLAQNHPRGAQYTPVAFLLDEAHGYSQELFTPGAFGLDPQWNPRLLSPGRHEAAIRGWFDIAYYPAPETQSQPANAVMQVFVNGVFGDIFDVIVTAPKKTQIAATYPVLVSAGEVFVTDEWGKALHDYVQGGGTLVVCADQFSGPGLKQLELPAFGKEGEAAEVDWKIGEQKVSSNVFHYRALPAEGARVLATAGDGAAIAASYQRGQGQLIVVGVPLGIGIDEKPVPLLALLMQHLTQGLAPAKVSGDVEWTINQLDDGGWLIGLLNNKGVDKPQHGMNPTDHAQAQAVTITVPFKVAKSTEWVTEETISWQAAAKGSTLKITVPAGVVRLVAVTPG